MQSYRIVSSAGQDMGTYTAADPLAALDAMARDAGYKSQADAEAQGVPFEGEVFEVPTQYRVIVGERGNEQGHVIGEGIESEAAARLVLADELAKYRGDGWGRIEWRTADMDGWERLEREGGAA